MSSPDPMAVSEIEVDRDNLYREDVYTDLRIATIRVLTPVKADGSVDEGRPRLYMGQTQIMSQAGPLPVQCPLEADSLDQAIQLFPDAVRHAVEQLLEEVREMQRREQSRIVVPNVVPGGGTGGPGGPKIIS